MKDFLLVLFYQAIVAVNTAVILIGIVWIAKLKEEKGGRKPPTTGNFGITEDTVKKAEMAAKSIGVSFDTLVEAMNAVPISVYNPAEESVERYEARTAQLPHYCGNCIAHSQEKFDGEIIHVCMRHKVWLHNQERWDGGCDAWEPSPAICKLYKEWADGFCSSCKYFEPEEPGQKRGMGLCARNDEIKMMGQSCTGYARKGELPKYLERKPMERPEPLGTITTH